MKRWRKKSHTHTKKRVKDINDIEKEEGERIRAKRKKGVKGEITNMGYRNCMNSCGGNSRGKY